MPVSSGYFEKDLIPAVMRQGGVKFRFIADSNAVLQRLDRKTAKVLGRTGGWGRRNMQNKLRAVNRSADRKFREGLKLFRERKITRRQLDELRKRTSSTPPAPPRQHEGTLRRLVFYAVDRDTQSVVIGPLRFKGEERPRGGKTGAQLLEEGGTIAIARGKFRKTVRVEPRPWLKDSREETEARLLKLVAEEGL